MVAVFLRAVVGFLRVWAGRDGVHDGRAGAVAILQRFGLVMDGVFARDVSGGLAFHEAAPLSDDDVSTVVDVVRQRVVRLLERRGHGVDNEGFAPDHWAEEATVLAGMGAASVQGRLFAGPRAIISPVSESGPAPAGSDQGSDVQRAGSQAAGAPLMLPVVFVMPFILKAASRRSAVSVNPSGHGGSDWRREAPNLQPPRRATRGRFSRATTPIPSHGVAISIRAIGHQFGCPDQVPRPPTRPLLRLAWPIVAAWLAANTLLVPGCSPTAPSTVPATDCTGAVLTPGPCDEPWAPGPDPVLPENRCPSAAEVAEIQEEIPVSVQADATAGTLACRAEDGSVDLTPARAAIIRGLLFMRRVRFDAPLPWTTKTLYGWLRDAIPNGVVLIASGNSYSCYDCRGPVYIYWPSGTRAVGVDVLSAAWIITHEARHTDNIRHTCKPVAPYGNTSDKTIAELGSMGADYYLRLWIATHTDEHPDTREYARRHAGLLKPSFCCECGRSTSAALPLAGWLTQLLLPAEARRASACGG